MHEQWVSNMQIPWDMEPLTDWRCAFALNNSMEEETAYEWAVLLRACSKLSMLRSQYAVPAALRQLLCDSSLLSLFPGFLLGRGLGAFHPGLAVRPIVFWGFCPKTPNPRTQAASTFGSIFMRHPKTIKRERTVDFYQKPKKPKNQKPKTQNPKPKSHDPSKMIFFWVFATPDSTPSIPGFDQTQIQIQDRIHFRHVNNKKNRNTWHGKCLLLTWYLLCWTKEKNFVWAIL